MTQHTLHTQGRECLTLFICVKYQRLGVHPYYAYMPSAYHNVFKVLLSQQNSTSDNITVAWNTGL